MIWTKLTRTDAVFSRACSAVLYCAGFWIFRYTGKIPKKYIKNQRSGSFRQSKGGHRAARGQPGGCLAQPSSWPRHLPSWVGPTPPGALLWPYLFSYGETPEEEPLFTSTSRSRRNPLFFLGELIWRLNWPSVRGNHRHHHLSITPP